MLADLPRSSASAIVRALKRHPQVAVPSQQGKRHKQISGTKKNGLDSYGIHGILFVTFLGLGQLGNLCRKVRENHWHPMVVPAIHDQCPCEYEPRIKRKPVDWVLRMVILPFLSFSFRKKIINPKFLKVFQSFLGVSRFQSHIFWPTNLEIWIQSFDHFPSDVTLLADGALWRFRRPHGPWIACGIPGKNGAFPPARGIGAQELKPPMGPSFSHLVGSGSGVGQKHGIMAALRAFPKAQASKLEGLV